MKRELKGSIVTLESSIAARYRKADPDEKGTESCEPAPVLLLSHLLYRKADPDEKGTESSYACEHRRRRRSIAKLIPMKRELKVD